MNNHSKIRYLVVLLMGSALLAGCVGRPVVIEEPPWYSRPSGAYDTANGRLFYGIGKAEGARNKTLLRATAVNRARQEMADVLDGYVAELFQTAGTMSALTVEDGEQLIGSLVSTALKRAVISDQWSDSRQPRLYALCRLDLDTFKQVLASHAIDARVREALSAKAEKAFALIEAQQR